MVNPIEVTNKKCYLKRMRFIEMKTALLDWYRANRRELPWRANQDPYRIWISETMLQQTTTTAVIPYFEKFVGLFPTLNSLAEAPVEHVLEAWAGLGYYSRARNLHKSAQALNARGGFPRTQKELEELPGFGPYTSRSVASLAFEEPVGVVDGNVIRVLSRVNGEAWLWWKSDIRKKIQALADAWVDGVSSRDMNQALMELGRTVCTPRSPSCLLCPLRDGCIAFRESKQAALPLARPKRDREIWIWEPVLHVERGQVMIGLNEDLPFLRGQWMLPGKGRKVSLKPKRFHYRHSITHHDIFVTIVKGRLKVKTGQTKLIPLKDLKKNVPVALVQKAVDYYHRDSERASDSVGVLEPEPQTSRRQNRKRGDRSARSDTRARR
jgi:A/G-specific adenine glycosylase